MNPSPEPDPAPRRRPSILRWVLGLTGAALVLLAIAVFNILTLASDAAQLRDGLLAAIDEEVHTKVQGSVGPVLLTALRGGVAFAPDFPSDARIALQAVRRASVGVYEVAENPSIDVLHKMFTAADAVMSRRGWSRVVGVNNDRTLVLIYMPSRAREGHTQQVCLAVRDDDNLVVVAGTIDAEPLAELVSARRDCFGSL